MILTTRNHSEIRPFVLAEAVPVEGGWTEGDPITGTYTTYLPRTQSTTQNSYRLTLGADVTHANLSPTILDTSDFPIVRAVEDPDGDVGWIRFTRGAMSIRKDFDVGVSGNPMTFHVPESITAETLLAYTHGLVMAKAGQSGKNDYRYRSIGGSGSAVPMGSGYLVRQPNPDCWANWDFSGVPLWNSSGGDSGQGGPQHGGVLIHPRVLVEAEHFGSPEGSVFKFMQPNGTLVTRKSIAVNPRPAGANNAETARMNEIPGDIRIHILDEATPAGIKTYPLAGPWARLEKSAGSVDPYLPWKRTQTASCPVVTVYLDQTRRAWFLGCYTNDCDVDTYSVDSTTWNGTAIALTHATCGCTGYGLESDFSEALQEDAHNRHRSGSDGDSGSCLFIPLSSTELAVFTCFTNSAGGPAYQEDRLNLLIAAACVAAEIPPITVTIAPSPI